MNRVIGCLAFAAIVWGCEADVPDEAQHVAIDEVGVAVQVEPHDVRPEPVADAEPPAGRTVRIVATGADEGEIRACP